MKKIFIYTALLTLFVIPSLVLAQQQQGGFISLTNIEGLFQSGQLPDLNQFLNRLFVIGIGIAAILAVIQIVIGGFQYMTTDALQGKQLGRERVTGAVLGLLLVLFTYILLYTINPGIVSFNLFETAPTSQGFTQSPAQASYTVPTTYNVQATCELFGDPPGRRALFPTMDQCQQQCEGLCSTYTPPPGSNVVTPPPSSSQQDQQLFNNMQQTVCTRQQMFENESGQPETITETVIFPNSEQCAAQCPRPGVTTFCTSG